MDGTQPSEPNALKAPTAPQPPFTLSGVVFNHTSAGRVPQPGVPLVVRSWGSGWPEATLLEITTDVNGRYEISGVPPGAVTIAPSITSDYRAPCPAGIDELNGNATFDVNVVSTALLSTAGAPSSMPRSSLWISGEVFEQASDGVRPIAGARVDLAPDDSDGEVISTTLTDAEGTYLLCTAPPGTGSDVIMWMRVRREGYLPRSRSVYVEDNYAAVELIRN